MIPGLKWLNCNSRYKPMTQEFDAGDPEQVQKRQQKGLTRDKRIANGLAQVLANADSRLWLFAMLEEAGPFRDPFTGNSHTFYNAGAQAWAKRLIATMLDSHLDAYTRMMKEGKADS